MSDVTLFLYVILLTSAVTCVHGYPTGAPLGQCDAMMPQHGVAPQSITPGVPYTVTASKSTYYGGETITVSIMGGNSQFKGLMLQARDPNDQRVGTFSLSPGDPNLKLLACGGVAGSSVTHTNRDLKNSISVTWTAPMDVGTVTFRATVVQQYNTFWVGLLSQPLTYMAMAPSGNMQPPLMNDTNTMATMAPANDNSNGMNNDMNTYYGPNSAQSLAGSFLLAVLTAAVATAALSLFKF